jgi:LysM repeat protein
MARITTLSSPNDIIKELFRNQPSLLPDTMPPQVVQKAGQINGYDDLVYSLEKETGMPREAAETAASGTLLGALERLGVDPSQWKFTVSPGDVKTQVYGPEQWENARKYNATWSDVASIALLASSVFGLVTLGTGAVIAGGTLAAANTAIRAGLGWKAVENIVKLGALKGIKWLSIPAGLTWIADQVAQKAGVEKQTTGDLLGYLLQSAAKAQATPGTGGGSGGTIGLGNNSPDLPKTIIRMVTEQKPQQFIGTLFSSKLGKAEHFERVLDDKITDLDDLEADVKINLNNWLKSLPTRMGYSIVIRKDPVDEYGAQQSGIWATLTMFMTHISGKVTPIDTILLGPVEPQVRLELQKKTTTVENQISGFIDATTVREIQIPNGSVDIFNAAGQRVLPSTVSNNTTAGTTPSVTEPSKTETIRPPESPIVESTKRSVPQPPMSVSPEPFLGGKRVTGGRPGEKTTYKDFLSVGNELSSVYAFVRDAMARDGGAELHSTLVSWYNRLTSEEIAAIERRQTSYETRNPSLPNPPSPVQTGTSPTTSSDVPYVVQSGDTLGAIAQRFGVAISNITGYRSGNPNLIFPGETLIIRS